MTESRFNDAIRLIASEPSATSITINRGQREPIEGLGRTQYTIHVHHCSPELVRTLASAGFDLCMEQGGLRVEDIGDLSYALL